MTKERDSLGCAKLVVLCNAPDDNPFMAGAFHGVSEPDAVICLIIAVAGLGLAPYWVSNVISGSVEPIISQLIR